MASTTPTAPEQPRIVPNARPGRYRSDPGWMWHGAGQQEDGVLAAAVAAWTWLPIALWLAVPSAVAGAAIGIFGSSPTGIAKTLHLNEGVGVLAAVVGALKGAFFGLALIYINYASHPLDLVGAVLSGLIIGAIALWILMEAEPRLMKLRGYRELSRREKERLHPLLLETARRMGLRTVPELWMSDSQIPGAWTHPRSIVITRGLLGDSDATERPPKSDLDEMALSAILAHELHHWYCGDAVGNRAVWACFWPVVAIYNGASLLRNPGGWLETAKSPQSNPTGWIGTVAWLLFWPAWVTTKLVVIPIMASASQRHEYEADAAVARLGDDYRLGLRRALDEFTVWEKPRTGWEDALAATHPPIELRLERLEEPPPPPDNSIVTLTVPGTTVNFHGVSDLRAPALEVEAASKRYESAQAEGDPDRIAATYLALGRAKQRAFLVAERVLATVTPEQMGDMTAQGREIALQGVRDFLAQLDAEIEALTAAAEPKPASSRRTKARSSRAKSAPTDKPTTPRRTNPRAKGTPPDEPKVTVTRTPSQQKGKRTPTAPPASTASDDTDAEIRCPGPSGDDGSAPAGRKRTPATKKPPTP
jgi:Zn-dependent protease with chaperone function